MNINIGALRERANITQAELAMRVGLSQAQISRYEADPDNISVQHLSKILQALGATMDLRDISHQPVALIDPGTPYIQIEQNLSLLKQYIQSAPNVKWDSLEQLPVLQDVVELEKQLGRKPNLVLTGSFDAGKSTIANYLIGQDYLPTSYQPTTRLITFLRHISTRPSWFKEELWIMKEGFNINSWNDEQHCVSHRLLAGNNKTLEQFTGDTSETTNKQESEAYFAVVYVNAPILMSCNIIDLPGYDDQESDAKKADSITQYIDILFYLSQTKGFLGTADLTRLGHLLKFLPSFEKIDSTFPILGNLFIVATHADPFISDKDLQKIRLESANRMNKRLGDFVLAEKSKIIGGNINATTLSDRIFTFWRENKERCRRLEEQLTNLLGDTLPKVISINIDQQVEQFKRKTKQQYVQQINFYQKSIQERDKVKSEYDKLIQDEPKRKKEMETKKKEIISCISRLRTETLQYLRSEYVRLTSPETVKQIIHQKFGDDKKSAQQDLPVYLIDLLQKNALDKVKNLSEHLLIPQIEQFLDGYKNMALSMPGSDGIERIDVPFDAQGAFMGGLVGLAGIGALSLWATSLGNLGGYIIAAKIVSWLSAIGISVGGTAGVMSVLAAVGGPVTLAIGLGVLLGFLGWALLGSSWQDRLANKIKKVLDEKNTLQKFEQYFERYWNETRDAFEKGAEEVEKQFVENLEKYNRFINTSQKQELESIIEQLERIKDFFAGIPWRTSS